MNDQIEKLLGMNDRIEKLLEHVRVNEQIERIAEQAGCTIDRLGYGEGNLEKFAELLVRECMLICGAIQGAGELRNVHEFASGAAQCRAIIKRDFGVEE